MVAFQPLDYSNPPLAHAYIKTLHQSYKCLGDKSRMGFLPSEDECDDLGELPMIDLDGLASEEEEERTKCATAIAHASCEWGFFQVVNHGVSRELADQMRKEQVNLFGLSFTEKSTRGLLNNSYRWGTPTAISPEYFSWSEAFHMPLNKVSDLSCYGEFSNLREAVMEYTKAMQKLARLLAGVLITNLGQTVDAFEVKVRCDEETCYLRLNRYPACHMMPQERVYGLVPHTDSDFLTILEQDQVGGLELLKDSKWVPVKPHKDALIVNIGDLFQAWSNGLYRSVEHRVMANSRIERFSLAYFLCPSYDSVIQTCRDPPVYKRFTFGQYRSRVQEDARLFGRKIGLSRFLL